MGDPDLRVSMFEGVIKRMETLGPEKERQCLERFLAALTVAVRILYIKNPEPKTRMRILVQTNEINHHVLNRVMTLQGGDKFFTVSYTWHAVEEHVDLAPVMSEYVSGFVEQILKDAGV